MTQVEELQLYMIGAYASIFLVILSMLITAVRKDIWLAVAIIALAIPLVYVGIFE